MLSGHNGIKLEIINGKKFGEFTSMWQLNTVLLNNHWVKEATEEISKYVEVNENKTTTYSNLWDADTAELKREFMAVNAYM